MSSQPGPAPGRAAVRVEGERSRSRILDAAERLLAERGFSGTGIAAISRESGLPASSIYWFFRNKRDLVAAVIERAADRWLDAFDDGTAPRGAATLRQFFERALELSGSRLPDFVRLQVLLGLERGDADPELLERLRGIRERALELVGAMIAAALAARGASPAAEQVRRIGAMAMAMAEGVLIAKHVAPEDVDLDRLAEDLEVAVLAIADRRLAGGRP